MLVAPVPAAPDVYLAFGARRGSRRPARRTGIAALLKPRGVRLEFVLDEGLLITEGMLPGWTSGRAGRRGGEGLRHAAAQRRARRRAIRRCRRRTGTSRHRHDERGAGAARGPADAGAVGGVAREMFETLAPEMSGLEPRGAVQPVAVRARWSQPQLRKAPSTNAMLRTTTALTIVQRRQQGQRAARPGRGGGEFPPAAGRHAAPRCSSTSRRRWPTRAFRSKRQPGFPKPSPVSSTESAPLPTHRSAPCASCSPTRSLPPG